MLLRHHREHPVACRARGRSVLVLVAAVLSSIAACGGSIKDNPAASGAGTAGQPSPATAASGGEAGSAGGETSAGGARTSGGAGGDAGQPNATAPPGDGGESGQSGIPEGEPCLPGQRILVGSVLNGRDLGGTPVEGGTVRCGAIYRASALANLTPEGCTAFAELGIRTVIDLRVESEVLLLPESACVTAESTIIQAPMPIPNYVSPAEYIADLNAVESVQAAFAAFGDEQAYPIYFHCTYGRDRSGVLAAIVLLALGATREEVMAEYQLSAVAGLPITPESLAAVLDEIEARGGIGAYLESAGVTEGELDVLRARAVAP